MERKRKELTEEDLIKKYERAKKRRHAEVTKTEKEKASTVERLLSRGQSRKKDEEVIVVKDNTLEINKIRHIDTKTGSFLCLPQEAEVPDFLQKQNISDLTNKPKRPLCALCGNQSRYTCSRTNIPICSLTCYKTATQQPCSANSLKA